MKDELSRVAVLALALSTGASCGPGHSRDATDGSVVDTTSSSDAHMLVDGNVMFDAALDAWSLDAVSVDARPMMFHPDRPDPASTVPCSGKLGFPGAPTISTNLTAPRFVVADFTGDGVRDVMVTTGNGVRLVAGNGDGTFGSPGIAVTAGVAVTAADVNGDGNPDLVALPVSLSTSVYVRLNSGNGEFGATTAYDMGIQASDVTTADVSGDGKPDLVALKTSSPMTMSVRLNTGAGFATQVLTDITGVVKWTFGDLDGDGKADLVTANSDSTVGVRLANGSGGFGSVVKYATRGTATSVAVADINGDSTKEVVVGSSEAGPPLISYVSVFATAGATLGGRSDYPTGLAGAPGTVALGDTNADGALDVVVARNAGYPASGTRPSMAWLPGSSSASFGSPVVLRYSGQTNVVAMDDLNGDGRADLTTADLGFVNTYLSSTATGVPVIRTVYAGPPTAVGSIDALTLQDLSSDGLADLVTIGPDAAKAWIRLGTSTGLSASTALPLSHDAYQAINADVNGDGRLDVVVFSGLVGSSLVNNGDGTLTETPQFAIPAQAPSQFAAGDMDNDGADDLFVLNDMIAPRVEWLRANGDGTYALAVPVMSATFIEGLAVGDVDGDEYRDLVVSYSNPPANEVAVFRGSSEGIQRQPIKSPFSVQGPLALRDFNHDGNLDLYGNHVVLFGDGTGHWPTGVPVGIGYMTTAAFADMNGDGHLDVIETSTSHSASSVSLGSASGSFGETARYDAGLSLQSLAVGDIDGDGRVDIAVSEGPAATVMYGRCIP